MYQQGLSIDFISGTTQILPQSYVEDFNATVQNGLVNIGTDLGSDAMWPTRGTQLRQQGLSGSIVGLQAARHACNFAALAALTFITGNAFATTETLQALVLTITDLTNLQLFMSAQFTSSLGTVVGTNTSM